MEAIIESASHETVFKNTDDGATAAHLAASQNLWEVLEAMIQKLGPIMVP